VDELPDLPVKNNSTNVLTEVPQHVKRAGTYFGACIGYAAGVFADSIFRVHAINLPPASSELACSLAGAWVGERLQRRVEQAEQFRDIEIERARIELTLQMRKQSASATDSEIEKMLSTLRGSLPSTTSSRESGRINDLLANLERDYGAGLLSPSLMKKTLMIIYKETLYRKKYLLRRRTATKT
jgi:hypothetical protein